MIDLLEDGVNIEFTHKVRQNIFVLFSRRAKCHSSHFASYRHPASADD
jgi:hypothetical protein